MAWNGLLNDIESGTKMKPKTYQVLTLAVEDGVTMGVHRAFKHSDDPGQEYIADQVTQAVLNSICEWFDLEDSQ